MAEGPVQNPELVHPRWHGYFTRDDLQEALRIKAESYKALGADDCIAITLNPQEFLLPEEDAVQFNDVQMKNHHMYFVVMTEQQWEAMKDKADARDTNMWWGYQEGRQAEEKQRSIVKTRRPNIRDADKIKVNTWVVKGELRQRTRFMVDAVSYQSRTHDPLPQPRIVILQWMKYPTVNPLKRSAKLAKEPPAPTPRGMDDRGPLPPHVPPPGPQDEGEPEGEGPNPGGNDDQEEEQQLDGSMGTVDMLFVKGKLESLVINHHKLEQQMAAISSRYVSWDELTERAPQVLNELCNLKGNLESLAMKHDLIEEQMDIISTGLFPFEELIEKAPQVINEVFSLKDNLESLKMKHNLIEKQMVSISTGLLSFEELVERAPQVVNEVFSLKDKLALLVEKTDTLEEQMATLSSSSLSWTENYKVLSNENQNLKEKALFLEENHKVLMKDNEDLMEEILFLKENYKVLLKDNEDQMEEVLTLKENYKVLMKDNEDQMQEVLSLKENYKVLMKDYEDQMVEVMSLKEDYKVLMKDNEDQMEEVLSLKENYKVLMKDNEDQMKEVLSLKTKAAPPSTGNNNPVGVQLKKTVSIIGMRKAKGKNKEVGLTLVKFKTDIKKEFMGVKKMLFSLRKANVGFSPVVPANECVREVLDLGTPTSQDL